MKLVPAKPLLPEYFRLNAKWRGHRMALIAGDEKLNWANFNGRLNQVANALHDCGLKPGARAAVFMNNGGPMVEVLFGLMKAGIASAPLNLSISDDAIEAMLRDCDAEAIFISAPHAMRITALLERMGKAAPAIRICEGEVQGWQSFKPWREAQTDIEPEADIQPDDILNIIYSSGTTGQPKGIVQTHQGRLNYAYDMGSALHYSGHSRFLATIGLYSNITWVGMLAALMPGGCLIVSETFEAEHCWRDIQDQRVTHLAMVPILYQRLADAYPDGGLNTAHVRNLMSAGSPLRPDLRKKLFAQFECGITELYGLTEGVITTLDPEEATGRMASCGLPVPGTDLLILDDNDQMCQAEETGEIVMRTRFVMPGYLNRDDATKDATYIDAQGQHWLRTGDIGKLDTAGYLYVVDRKKDMILSGGQNIYPQDIEAVIATHEAVDDVAVIGVKSRKWGETPLALVTLHNGALNPSEIKAWVNQRLGRQQRVADVRQVSEIPRNPNGKVLKRTLRESYQDTEYD